VSWGWLNGFEDAWVGFGAQQQNADWHDRGIQNQMANAHNQQSAYIAIGKSSAQSLQDLLTDRPGGVIRVSRPDSVQCIPRPKPAGDCKGCGAPLKPYIHHCEYCRRAAC